MISSVISRDIAMAMAAVLNLILQTNEVDLENDTITKEIGIQ